MRPWYLFSILCLLVKNNCGNWINCVGCVRGIMKMQRKLARYRTRAPCINHTILAFHSSLATVLKIQTFQKGSWVLLKKSVTFS